MLAGRTVATVLLFTLVAPYGVAAQPLAGAAPAWSPSSASASAGPQTVKGHQEVAAATAPAAAVTAAAAVADAADAADASDASETSDADTSSFKPKLFWAGISLMSAAGVASFVWLDERHPAGASSRPATRTTDAIAGVGAGLLISGLACLVIREHLKPRPAAQPTVVVGPDRLMVGYQVRF